MGGRGVPKDRPSISFFLRFFLNFSLKSDLCRHSVILFFIKKILCNVPYVTSRVCGSCSPSYHHVESIPSNADILTDVKCCHGKSVQPRRFLSGRQYSCL